LKSKGLLLLIANILVIISFALVGCQSTNTPQATTTTTPTTKPTTTAPSPATTVVTQTVEVDKKYNCLSPQGIQLPVQVSPLAPRLTTFDGIVAYVNQGEADPIIMPALWERVQKDYPKTTWKYIATSSFGPNTPEQELIDNKARAVIRGISW
jgi:hypothetical protein